MLRDVFSGGYAGIAAVAVGNGTERDVWKGFSHDESSDPQSYHVGLNSHA